MASVDPIFAQWLQSPSDTTLRTGDDIVQRWGVTAGQSERQSAIATRNDAEAEADRVLAFFARGPFAEDVHDIVGTHWGTQLGCVVTLTLNQLDYDQGVEVMVTGVEVDRSTGMSTVTVLCPLRRN